MVGFPAARLTDLHICPMFTVLVPHVGGPIAGPGAPTVLIGKLPAARVTDMCVCVGPPDMIAKGSATVFTMKMPQARILDNCVHGGIIVLGCFTVLVGDGAGGGGGGGGAAAALLAKILSGKSQIKLEGPPEFQLKTMIALAKLASTPTGLGLLQSLDAAPHTTTIKPSTDGTNSENGAGFTNPLTGAPGPGTDTEVFFNPDKDKLNGRPDQTRDPAIGLGHELIHANHDVHGTNVKASSNYTGADGNTYNAPGYEQQAVGLGPYANDPYTENKLRKEFDEQGISKFPHEHQRPRY
jgi:type VI secretion system secreted protein VgrG